jgi:hypothetical protein
MTADLSSRTIGLSDGPAHVDLLLSLEPPRQNRISIFLRWLLALPHFFVLGTIFYIACIGAIGGWFAALFTGRLPRGLQKFLTGYLRYAANVDAYSTLLTNKWPSINFEPQADSMVDVDISQVPLNRLAVLGRIVLAIPAYVVGTLFGFGVYPCLFTMWVVGSVTGKVPRPLHQAVATILRFQFRLLAYMLLVTPLQPFSGVFGDVIETAQAVDGGAELGSSDGSEGTWRIVVWARRLIVATLVIGLIGSALYFSFRPNWTSTKSDSALFVVVSNSYNSSVTELNIIVETFSTCTTASCISAAIEGAGDTHLYQATLALEKAAPYPSGVSSDLQKYIVSLIDVQKDINAVAKATTIAQQREIVSGKVELDVGNLTYRGIEILIYLGEQPNFSGMRFQW